MSTSERPEKSKRERQDWLIVLLILLLGFACVLVAGQYALHFAPSWQLDTDMESNLDLNSEFLTSRPVGFFEPLDPAILTQPSWVNGNVFLTPGAANSLVDNGTPLPTSGANTQVPTVIGTTVLATHTTVVTNTTVPTSTLVWIPIPATKTSKPNEPVNTATNLPPPTIDLEVSMDDGVGNYSPNAWLLYTVTITNNSSYNLSGVTVTDTFSAQIDSVNWSCGPAPICTSAGTGDINDIISIPAGQTVTYQINAHVSLSAMGPLLNTVSVTAPPGFTEPDTSNNTSADTDTDPALALNIGSPDGTWNNLASNGILTMVIPAIVANGDGAYDFVYYERVAPSSPGIPDPHVDMDWVQIEISQDGSSWQTVFYWGSGGADTNSNVAVPIDWCATETDNCHILNTSLYNSNSTGIAIDVDTIVPSGNYPWIRITAPGGDDGDGCDIDAIQILP